MRNVVSDARMIVGLRLCGCWAISEWASDESPILRSIGEVKKHMRKQKLTPEDWTEVSLEEFKRKMGCEQCSKSGG